MPQRGPIAIGPHSDDVYSDAVVRGGGEVGELSSATRGLVWLSIDSSQLAAVLTEHPGIEWVQLPLAGVEKLAGVLGSYANSALPLWTSAKGAYAEPVAEHALALTLAALRGIPEKARSGGWAKTEIGISLFGRNVVIVGAGGVALEVMRLLAPFDVSVTIVRRSPLPVQGAGRTVTTEQLIEVLPDADVVILAAAATPATHHLIGVEELSAMKSTAALINIARGELVDHDALVAALERGHLSGAGLDVTTPEPLPDEHPLWSAPRCVITSHAADTREMVQPLLAERIRVNVSAFMAGGGFVGIVDPGAGY